MKRTEDELHKELLNLIYIGLAQNEYNAVIDNSDSSKDIDVEELANNFVNKKSEKLKEEAKRLLFDYEASVSSRVTDSANENILSALNGTVKKEVKESYDDFYLEYKKDNSLKQRIVDGIILSIAMMILWFVFSKIYNPNQE